MSKSSVRLLSVVVATLTALVCLSQPANASVRVVDPSPVRIVLSGPSVSFGLTVVSSTPTTARGGFGVLLDTPMSDRSIVEGEAWSDDPAISVSGALPSRRMVLGAQVWEIEDLGDGRVTRVPVTVVRASRVAVRFVTPLPGAVAGSVSVTHYDPSVGQYTPAQSSPVWVQSMRAGRWVTVATWTTDSRGVAVGAVSLPAGPVLVRFVRPEGARDAVVTSGVTWVTVL